MRIKGADYHPSFQQIAYVDTETGECGERKLMHTREAECFYRGLSGFAAASKWEARRFVHLAMRRGNTVANLAMARRLAVRLYWMWRKGWDYQQTLKSWRSAICCSLDWVQSRVRC